MKEKRVWEPDATIEFVALTSGGQGFCVEITSIREIRRWTAVSSLPHADESVLGVMNLRGAVIPIIDLAARLGMNKTEIGERNVVVVAAVGSRIVGLLVDAVSEILSVKGENIRPNPTQKRDGEENHIIGLLTVDDTMLRVLDLEALYNETGEEVE